MLIQISVEDDDTICKEHSPSFHGVCPPAREHDYCVWSCLCLSRQVQAGQDARPAPGPLPGDGHRKMNAQPVLPASSPSKFLDIESLMYPGNLSIIRTTALVHRIYVNCSSS